jgi:hypothetical protein
VLPDGIFLNQKSKFVKILERIAIEDVGIFKHNFVYFTAKCSILCSYGTFIGHLIYFSRFGMLYGEKSGNPAFAVKRIHQEEKLFLHHRRKQGDQMSFLIISPKT